MPATILFAHSSNELYGSDIVLLELVRHLDAGRFRPLVVMPTDSAFDGLLGAALQGAGIAYRSLDIPVLRRRYLSPGSLPGFVKRVRQAPALLQPVFTAEQVVLVHSNTSAVWGGAYAARQVGLPHLWHVHEIVNHPRLVRRLIAWTVAHWSDHVVAISHAVADHLLADEPALKSKLSVIHDAVDTNRFHPDIDGRSVRSEWNIDSDTVVAGVVGRISRWKGQSLFLEALAHALAESPHLRGRLKGVIVGDVVAGEETRRHDLEQLAVSLGIADQVIWAGYRRDTPQVMAALDILVLPSTEPEPFGMVVVEAMASGRPVVATAHGGPLETVEEGDTGFLVSPADAYPMAQALVRLASDAALRRQMGDRGRLRASGQFGLSSHVGAFESLYGHLLGRL